MSIVDFFAIFLAGILLYFFAENSHMFRDGVDTIIYVMVILAGSFLGNLLGNLLGTTLFEDKFFALPKSVLTYIVPYCCVFLFGSLQPKSDKWSY